MLLVLHSIAADVFVVLVVVTVVVGKIEVLLLFAEFVVAALIGLTLPVRFPLVLLSCSSIFLLLPVADVFLMPVLRLVVCGGGSVGDGSDAVEVFKPIGGEVVAISSSNAIGDSGDGVEVTGNEDAVGEDNADNGGDFVVVASTDAGDATDVVDLDAELPFLVPFLWGTSDLGMSRMMMVCRRAVEKSTPIWASVL